MRAFKHFFGAMSIAIILDYFLFDGYCTNAFCESFSDAYVQILSEFRTFL